MFAPQDSLNQSNQLILFLPFWLILVYCSKSEYILPEWIPHANFAPCSRLPPLMFMYARIFIKKKHPKPKRLDYSTYMMKELLLPFD